MGYEHDMTWTYNNAMEEAEVVILALAELEEVFALYSRAKGHG